MRPFTRLDAIAAPLPIANVDTDKILAGRFLKTITRAGLGEKLFWSLRRDPGFVLNRAPWDQAGILIALDNFGCGSSREHAPWALLDFGIHCVISPSIADIFYNNCCKNGILPIVLPSADILNLIDLASDPTTARMAVDLSTLLITAAAGHAIPFSMDEGRRQDLLVGIDDIHRTLQKVKQIDAFEAQHSVREPWIGTIDKLTNKIPLVAART